MTAVELWRAPPCTVCGPLHPPHRHALCHPVAGLRRFGCGHPLSSHTPGLRCRLCGQECGVDCR